MEKIIDDTELEEDIYTGKSIKKSYDDGDFFMKAKALPDGTERTWSGVDYRKEAGKWKPVGKGKKGSEKDTGTKNMVKMSSDKLTSHAENTSSEQLKKVIDDESKHPHVRDAAKRELERRKSTDLKTKQMETASKRGDEEYAANKKAQKEEKESALKEKEEADKKAKAKEKEAKKKSEQKKPAFSYSPSDTLSDEHSKIEQKFGKYLTENYKEAKDTYTEEFGNVLNTDNARDLSRDYLKNKAELSAAVHEPSSAFIKKIYADELSKPAPKGARNLVYFTAGGTGAGKSSSLMGAEKKFHDKSHIVYNTNMNGFASAKKKIDQALEAGKKVRLNYTFRDPVDAFENGAVPRSLRIGRTVPIESHIDTHIGSMSSVQALHDHYKGNNNVKILITDNSRGQGNAKQVPISFVKEKEKSYVASDLRDQLHKINDKLFKQGKIPRSHYVGFKGHDDETK